jgi:hypothetical protein
VQDEIVEKWRSEDLRVYVVWLPFLGGTRDSVDGTLLADPRVRHYWDGAAVSSSFFGQHLPGGFGQFWDGFAVYGPDARWGDEPGPLIASGVTVIGESASLKEAIQTLLGPPESESP